MYFESWSAALQMGGHGGYVWAAYGITLAVVVFILVAPGRRAARQRRQVAGELRRLEDAPTGKEDS